MNFGSGEQLEKARLEDVLVDILYSRYKELILHGGTAIWRCYSGNRFSRDIDFYMAATHSDKKLLFRELSKFLEDQGFVIKEKGYDNTTDTMHFLVGSTTKMKIDINLRQKKGAPVEYTRVDESRTIVLSLTPEELLDEKINAYEDKMRNESKTKQPEVQDLYDIYYLTKIARKGSKTIKKLTALIEKVEKNPPPNLRSLDHLILSGVPPTFDFMIKKIKEWVYENQ